MKEFAISHSYFLKLHEAWKRREQFHMFDGFDQEIIDILILLNRLEGVATQSSCAGHMNDYDPKIPVEQPNGTIDPFYLAFSATPEGLDNISRVYRLVYEKMFENNKIVGRYRNTHPVSKPDEDRGVIMRKDSFSLQLQYRSRKLPTDENHYWYPAITMHYRFITNEERLRFHKYLRESLHEMLD